jgi:hypothetical protein
MCPFLDRGPFDYTFSNRNKKIKKVREKEMAFFILEFV